MALFADLSGLRVLFVTFSNNLIGAGHLNRCLNIADTAREFGAEVEFLLFGDDSAKSRLIETKLNFKHYDSDQISDLGQATLELNKPDIIICDVINWFFFKCTNLELWFDQLRQLDGKCVLIDNLGEDSFAHRCSDQHLDVVVCPYVSNQDDLKLGHGLNLSGEKYALLKRSYSNLKERIYRPDADRVLITCGGSDPQGYTLDAVKALDSVSAHLQVRVVLGPLIDAVLAHSVRLACNKSHHDCEVTVSPPDLLDDMLWCDVAISTSGLTKYELAATGTPTILFSIDKEHHQANSAFRSKSTAIDLGIGVVAERLSGSLQDLLFDHLAREKMGQNAMKLIDGEGSARLLCRLKAEIKC